jgi:hypothetical protein
MPYEAIYEVRYLSQRHGHAKRGVIVAKPFSTLGWARRYMGQLARAGRESELWARGEPDEWIYMERQLGLQEREDAAGIVWRKGRLKEAFARARERRRGQDEGTKGAER